MNEPLALLGGEPCVTHSYPPYPVIDHEEVNAATRVVMSGMLSDCGRGVFVAEMEDAYAAFFHSSYCLSFISGTAALHSALFALGVGPGDEVLLANHNWISPIMAVFHAGAIPVLCDVAPGSFAIDAEEIRRKTTPRTKVVIATHLWGLPAEMDSIMKAAQECKLKVIEDVSHAHGGRYNGRYLGTIGDIGCFSLQGSKSIVGGEAGFLLTEHARYYQRAIVPGHHTMRLQSLEMFPEVQAFSEGGGGYTYRIPTVSAAIATAQLKKLPTLNAARQANFDRLRDRLADVPFLTFPDPGEGSVRGWYGAPAFFDAGIAGMPRDRFVQACQAEGAGIAGEGYCDWSQIAVLQDTSLLSQLFTTSYPSGAEYRPIRSGSLPHNEDIRRRMLLFTIPALAAPQLMDQVARAIQKVARQAKALATA